MAAAVAVSFVLGFFILQTAALPVSTTTLPTNQGPPTTTTECTPGESATRNCSIYFCNEGQWAPFEPVLSSECCRKHYNPMCAELYPDYTTPR